MESRDDLLAVLSDVSGSRYLHKPRTTSSSTRSSPTKLTLNKVHIYLNEANGIGSGTIEWRVASGSVHQHRLPLENVVELRLGVPNELREHSIHFINHHQAPHQYVFSLVTNRKKFLVLQAPNSRKFNHWVASLRLHIPSFKKTKLATMGKKLLRESKLIDPLTVAATNNDVRTIESYVRNRKRHRSVHSKDQPSIESALFFAAAGGHAHCVEPLLTISAAFYRHHDGNTVMHAAIKSRNSKVVRMIAQYNLNLTDEPDAKGNTPVHMAVERGDKDSLLALLQTAAETNMPNPKGLTPLAVARQRRAKLKRSRSSSSGNDVEGLIRTANEIVKLLKSYGASMTPRNRSFDGSSAGGETDMNRIMSIWNQFFENAMKWRMGESMMTNGTTSTSASYTATTTTTTTAPMGNDNQLDYFPYQPYNHQPYVPAIPSFTPRNAWGDQSYAETKSNSNSGGSGGWKQNRDDWYQSNENFQQRMTREEKGEMTKNVTMTSSFDNKYTVYEYNGNRSNKNSKKKKGDSNGNGNTSRNDAKKKSSTFYSLDWQTAYDNDTGQYYSVHRVTGESKWNNNVVTRDDPRLESASITTREDDQQQPNLANSLIDENWVTLVDPDTQCLYYYNEQTGESQWASNDIVTIPQNEEEGNLNISAQFDDTTQSWYYYDHTSGISSWAYPNDYNTTIATTSTTTTIATANVPSLINMESGYGEESNDYTFQQQQQQPVVMTTQVRAIHTSDDSSQWYNNASGDIYEWEAIYDDNSGMYYYQNISTGETQWESPYPEVVLDEEETQQQNQPLVVHAISDILTENNGSTTATATSNDIWEAVWDDANEAYYYYNSATGETQW